MRKILTPFVAALLLLLTLSPQAKAAPINPASTTTATPFTIYHTGSESSNNGRFEISYEGTWGSDTQPIFQYRILKFDGTQSQGWTDATVYSNKVKITTTKCSGGNTYFILASPTLSSSYPSGWAIQFRLKSGYTWNVNKTHWITFKFRYNSTNTAIGLTGNIMSLVANSFENVTEIPSAGCFYKLFSDDTSSASNVDIQCNNLLLPATTLKNSCYEDMFSGCSSFLKTGPNIMAFSPESNCAEDCFKNMFNGCSGMTTLTTNFLTWGSGSGTANWLNGCSACKTVNCPSALTATTDKDHIGTAYTSGSGNVSPSVYVFNVADNSGTWNGTCQADKYYTTAAPTVPDPNEDGFTGWYTESTGGSAVTPSSLSAPTNVTKYYAQFSSATTFNVAIASYNSDYGTVTVAYNDGVSDQTLTSGNTDILNATTLTITAVPNSGYKLTGLTITPSGGDPSDFTSGNEHTLTADITVTATFVAKSFTLGINSTSHGSITCDNGTYVQGAAAQSIAVGTTVTFTATPDEHYELTGWTGAVSGTGLEKSLTVTGSMDEALTVGATFALEQFTISATAANPAMGSVTGGNTYSYGAAVTLTATANDGYRFVEWSDGNSSNPRNLTASENLNLTATFALESTPQTVEVYQNATANTTKILYALTAKTVGGITYTPIDLGYGVAWSDKNMGATDLKPAGNYYAWGNLSSGTSFSATSYYNGSTGTAQGFANGTALPNDHDAANQTIGSYWHIPSPTQWTALLNNCSVSSYTYTGANGNSITLPATGYYNTNGSSTTSLSNTTNYYYWTNTKGFYSSTTGNNSGIIFEDGAINGNGTFEYDGRLGNGLAIRPIYVPTFTIYTLTINVGSYKYVYKCQSGQSITVNVHATELGASFDEWSEDHNTNATRTFTVTGNATYTATFAEATTYAITFVDEDGETVLDGPNDVIEGNIPVYGGETPTKAATAQYTYAFDGWSPALYAADKAQTYTATYSSTVNQYTVTWKSENGESTLETDADQNYGTTTAFNGTTPTKAADAEYTYTFDGWATEANGDLAYANGSTPTVSGDATYFAHFNATEIVTAFNLEDNHEAGDDYYDDYAALVTAGNAIDITYKRSFTAGRWATFSLPFGYSFQNPSHNTFRDQVFELTSVDYADGRMVINCVKNSTGIVKNTPYILIPTSDIVNPTFEGVTPQTIAAGSKTVNNTKDNVYTVEFISTAYKQVMPTGKRTIYISGNRLYYANVDTDIPAFRGYFNLKGGDEVLHIQPRLVIAAPDGETIEQAEEAVAETRKYMENGILVIERNGVKYDAQGHVIK